MDDSLDFLEDIQCIKSEGKEAISVRISLQKFLAKYVEVSQNGGNSIDVAKELGISPQAVRQRASKLLNKGVKLPRLGNICRKEIASTQTIS